MRAVLLAAAAATAAPLGDLQRAKAKVPRAGYKGSHFRHMGQVLNGHLRRAHPRTKPCHEWAATEVQAVQEKLFALREPRHDAVYAAAADARALRHGGIESHTQLWRNLTAAVGSHRLLREMQRDGHCHEAVMWYTHHLSHSGRAAVGDLVLPELPLVEWREPIEEEGPAAAKLWKAHYNPSSTCQGCHAGGMSILPGSDPEPAPLPRQVNGNDRRRRCDEWFGDAEGGVCSPCDGTAGAQWGDMPDESIYPTCEVVGLPADVPESERTPTAFPRAYAVEMRGADRWPRAAPSANASCNYTSDCGEIGTCGVLGPPVVGGKHWYAQLHGVLYADHPPGHFAGGVMNHQAVYECPNGREGAERALNGMFGLNNIHVGVVIKQTAQEAVNGEPKQFLTITHNNMNVANKSGQDDTTFSDWRRMPNDDGFCVCTPAPVGLPDFMGSFSNSTYAGRVKFIPQYQTTGTGGPADGKYVIADSYMKWNFHLFVSVDTFLPVMFSSPYGGMSTYGNWSIPPDYLWPESVAGGWRKDPPHCVNVADTKTCEPYV